MPHSRAFQLEETDRRASGAAGTGRRTTATGSARPRLERFRARGAGTCRADSAKARGPRFALLYPSGRRRCSLLSRPDRMHTFKYRRLVEPLRSPR